MSIVEGYILSLLHFVKYKQYWKMFQINALDLYDVYNLGHVLMGRLAKTGEVWFQLNAEEDWYEPKSHLFDKFLCRYEIPALLKSVHYFHWWKMWVDGHHLPTMNSLYSLHAKNAYIFIRNFKRGRSLWDVDCWRLRRRQTWRNFKAEEMRKTVEKRLIHKGRLIYSGI
jgi:hypothetical protein